MVSRLVIVQVKRTVRWVKHEKRVKHISEDNCELSETREKSKKKASMKL